MRIKTRQISFAKEKFVKNSHYHKYITDEKSLCANISFYLNKIHTQEFDGILSGFRLTFDNKAFYN